MEIKMTIPQGIRNRLICKFLEPCNPEKLDFAVSLENAEWRGESGETGDRHLIKVSSWQQQVDPSGK